MKHKSLKKRISSFIKYKIFRIEKPPKRTDIWEAIEHSGWTAYEAYCNLIAMKKEKFIDNYSDANRRNINIYKKELVNSMLEGKNRKKYRKMSEDAFSNWFFTERQKNAIEQIKKGRLTNRVLSDFLMIRLPDAAGDEDTDISTLIRTTINTVTEGTILFWSVGKVPKLEKLQWIKPKYVICATKYKRMARKAGFAYVAKMNLSAYIYELSRLWLSNKDVKTVEITGTVGKSTTTEMTKSVVGDAFSMYAITGNQNTSVQVANFVYRLKAEHEVFVQETAGSTPGQLERSSKVLEPDVFIITNIGHGHIGNYGGSREFLLHEKLAIERHAAKNAIGIVNMDDDLLRASSYSHDIRWFSINNPDADFYAKDIREHDGVLSFVVVEKDNTETKIDVGVVGIHNAYNALSAFAVGVLLGIDRESIAKSLCCFKTKGIRQHFVQYGGKQWYIDCYSVTEESVKSHIEALNSLKNMRGGSGKRILVLGDIIQPLGDKAEEIHLRLGDIIVNSGCVDKVFLYGRETRHTYEVIKNSDVECCYTDRLETVKDWVERFTDNKDIVGFKANSHSEFEWIIDDICGTDYYFSNLYLYDYKIKIYDGITYKINERYGAGISSTKLELEEITISESIDNYRVRVIGKNSFYNNKMIKKINLSDSLMGIGNSAFKGCSSLSEISFGKNLKYIGEDAFKGCDKIEMIDLSETQIEAIESGAFAECGSLKRVILPKTSIWISENSIDAAVEILQ